MLVAAAGCSSSSATGPATGADGGKHVGDGGHSREATVEGSAGGVDAHPDVIIDPSNCVAPSAASSENGVGGYCSPGAGQCAHAGAGGTATLCTADIPAPSHEWFCTIPCSAPSDCGPGGGACLSAPFGQICVPPACAGNLGDASSLVVDSGDASADGASDAPHDAGHDAAEAHDAATSHDARSDGAVSRDAAADAPKG